MSIAFNQVPSNILAPFVGVEFDGSQATVGPAELPYRALIMGQKMSAGTAVANTRYKLTADHQAIPLFGRGSMLHRQAIRWFRANKFTEAYFVAVADNGAGVTASGTLTFTGPATETGVLYLYLGGERLTIGITTGDSATTIATAVAAAITAAADLPVTATSSSGVVTVTHRHKGTIGNDFDMRANYNDGEKLPAGVTLAVVALASGAANPTLTSVISSLGDAWFHVIVFPWTDATSLTAIEAEMLRRDGPTVQVDGQVFASTVGSVGTMGALGDSRNSKYVSIVSQDGENPVVPTNEHAAGVGAVVAYYSAIDQARPLQTLDLGMLPPAEIDRFTFEERNLLLQDGISTTKTVTGGSTQIDRLVTNWQTNASGAPDSSYRSVENRFTLMRLRYDWVTSWKAKYPRHKLADNGTEFGPGQPVMTPSLAKGEALLWFKKLELEGLLENYAQFKRDLVVLRNTSNRDRLDFILPPDLMNQLVVAAAQMQFRT